MTDDSGYIQFLAEARSGGQAAMSRLAVLVWERLYPFVLRTTLDRDATEDVLQETLLTMVRRLNSLRDGGRFWPWIYRIAWNHVQDRLRHRRRQTLCETALYRRADADRVSGADDPLNAQIRAETLQRVCAAMIRLNHRYRDILELRCCEGLSYVQIAARTRTSPDKARVRFHRARKSLQTQLACCT